jgi:hypothetical protein
MILKVKIPVLNAKQYYNLVRLSKNAMAGN